MIDSTSRTDDGRRGQPVARFRRAGGLACGAALLASGSGFAQNRPEGGGAELPFGVGEALEFEVTSSRFGRIGSAWMRVTGPESLRGREVLRLSMETRGRVALFGYEDRAHSWFDPRSLSSLRYEKEERHPLGTRQESVEIFPAENRWVGREGEGGILGADEPLDELSFIYFIRTLALDPGWTHTLRRHFDPARNPVRIRVGEMERLTVPAGTFMAVPVEMRVRDPRRYEGSGEQTLRIHFSADARRIPLRIESTAPMVGTVVMTLKSAVSGDGRDGSPPPSGSADAAFDQ